ncbi:MAG TPA: gluconate 2-dehydrogenase subunit 3 family protein [Mycobacteriales bacterium]|nr:gluconate 2-dehydrogenase subunit 3 family protein [Mycobacteriales bacterium]
MTLLRGPAESAGRVIGGAPVRFPGFDVLGEVEHWDAATAGVVLSRLTQTAALHFFTPAEEAVGRALFDQLLDQRREPRVPVIELIDARLCEGQTDGWHYGDMPEDGDAFRESFAALDADALDRFGDRFAALEWRLQGDLIRAVQQLKDETWHGLRADRVWSLWTRYACTAFYSHPWAWNEIGFGGPAYPRGYKNIGIDAREPWEVADVVDLDPVSHSE